MDIKRPSQKTPLYKSWPFLTSTAALTICIVWFMAKSGSTAKVAMNQLLFAEVKQGDLAITVEGYGVLRSARQKLLTALNGATVEEIVLKPGALVDSDSVILKLGNPELLQTMDSAKQALAQEKANLRKLKLNHKSDLLQEQSKLAELETNLMEAQLNLEAQSELHTKGVVSHLQFKQTELTVKKFNQQLKILWDRLAQLKLVHEEAINIQIEIIKQAEGRYQTQQHRMKALTVRAGMAGVLQRLSVSLGQSVTPGQELALIGSTDQLEAHIRVPQTRAEQVKIGQSVSIDTRRDKISGQVYRIDPAVEEGTVLVEVSLQGPLPGSARPELNVDGVIKAGFIANTLYIERPVNARANTIATLFKLIDGRKRALATKVELGVEVGRFIQVINGAQPLETFILSDLSHFQGQQELSIQ